MKKHIDITIEGRLKEKDFNYYCQTGAHKFDLHAIYTNGNDIDIFIQAEGDAENLEKYVEYLRTGPLSSSLISFNTKESEVKDIKGFSSYRRHVGAQTSFFKKLKDKFNL